jgi:hypothetical protein
VADLDRWAPCEGGVVCHAPNETWIRVRPRCRDGRSLQDRIAELTGDAHVEVTAVAELVTPEAEVATIGGARFSIGNVERECVVAIVGDDPYMCIDGVGASAEMRSRVMILVCQLGLGLGRQRRRPFHHEAPAGWTRQRRADSTLWLHPEQPARITVFDARPFIESVGEQLDRSLFLRSEEELDPAAPDQLENLDIPGLEGRLRITRGFIGDDRVVRAVAALADDTFLYLAHCETHDEDLAPFRALLDSIVPLPRAEMHGNLIGIWNDE